MFDTNDLLQQKKWNFLIDYNIAQYNASQLITAYYKSLAIFSPILISSEIADFRGYLHILMYLNQWDYFQVDEILEMINCFVTGSQ